MNAIAPTSEERAEKLQGLGCKRKRVEDIRFVQGKGNYVDDLKLPGTLYGDLVRSPHAHARIKSIDVSEAMKVPGVLAVLTAAALKPLSLHYMPTLAGDVQAVLAEEKVLFQNQEVAFVVAETREAAADAVDLVEVVYEGAARGHRPVQGDGARRAGAARGHQGQDRRRARQAQALQPYLYLGDGRQGRDRRGLRARRSHDQGIDLVSARASVAARDLPVRRLVRQGARRIDGMGHVPGAPCHPHRGVADLQDSRAQDPRDLARYRRRLRQQGRRLSGLYLRDRRLDRHRQARQMGRGPDREPLLDLLRPRLSHDDRDRRPPRRQGHGPARARARRPRRVRRLRRSFQMAGGLLQHRHRLVRLPGRALRGRRRLYQQGAGRRRLSLLVPRHRGRLLHRAGDGHPRAEARHGPGRTEDEKPDPARAVPVSVGARLGIRFRRLSRGHAEGDGLGRLPEAARRAEGEAGGVQARRDARAHGHRRRLLHRNRRRGPVEELRHSRHRDVRQRRDPHPSDRLGDRAPRHQVAGPGPRDDLRPNHRERARPSRRRHHGRGRQHRHRALWPRHLRLALDAGLRRGDRDGGAQDQGQGADDRRPSARGARRRSRMGRRPLPRQGRARALQDDEGAGLGGLQFRAQGHGDGPRGGQLLRSAEHDLSVRGLYLRRRRRRRNRRDQDPLLLRARRLRHPHQSDDHRGAGAWRTDRGLRHRDGPGDPLRRNPATC